MLDQFLRRPLAPVDPKTRAELVASPLDPRDALTPTELDSLLDPAPHAAEVGWCRLADGTGYVAMRVEMPDVSAEMIDWWFDWHPEDPLRYRVWHPIAHHDISFERPKVRRAKGYWGAIHHPVEDVGLGRSRLRIEFQDPTEFGFSERALLGAQVATVVCGIAGDDTKRARHTKMAHVWLNDPSSGGTVLRSRFWIGSVIRPYLPPVFADPASRLLNRRAFRRRLIPADAPAALAGHCAEEYTNLAAILPELYRHYA